MALGISPEQIRQGQESGQQMWSVVGPILLFPQIDYEIRAVQTAPVPPSWGMPPGWYRRAMLAPWPLSRLVQI